jgi:hypothetical protein
VEAGKLAASGALVDFNPTPGRLIVGVVSQEKIEGDGAVVVAKFKILGRDGQKTAIALEQAAAWEATADRMDVKVTTTAGELTVGGGLPWLWIALAALIVLGALMALSRRRKPVGVTTAPVAAGPGARFCSNCGAPVSGAFCGACGTQVPS